MMSIICIPYNISFVSLYALLLSHPTRVRGLKWEIGKKAKMIGNVAPHPGAWIEMKNSYGRDELTAGVAPHPGAWIEIIKEIPTKIAASRRTPPGCVD